MKKSDQLLRPTKATQLSSLQPLPQTTSPATTPRTNLPSITRGRLSATRKQARWRDGTSATTAQRACLSCATWWTTSACTSDSNRTPATTAAKPGPPGATVRTTWRSAHAWDLATGISKTQSWPSRSTEKTSASIFPNQTYFDSFLNNNP